MTLWGSLKYHLNVDLLGKTYLRLERLKFEKKLKNKAGGNEYFGPPLAVSPWLKELVSGHYMKGRYINEVSKVAWVTSGAPVEFLQALGFFLIYPENHAAVCGIRRTAQELCEFAEDHGFARDICSYARTDIGSVLSGKTPVGRLPRPDILLCCNNICQTVLYWYRMLAEHFKVPLIIIDTPFIYDRAEQHVLDYVKKQLEEGIEIAEKVADRSLDYRKLKTISRRAKECTSLWLQIIETAKTRPAPLTAFDQFVHMGPIVEMRGELHAIEYYRAMLAELNQRVAKGVGALKNEKKRLVWDNLPIWFRLRKLSKQMAARGVALVASTYTNAWGELAELIEPEKPLESAAKVYVNVVINRSVEHKLNTLKRLVDDFQADGVILHSDRSCKPYSIGQMDQHNRIVRQMGKKALLLEADHNDPRLFTEEQAQARIEPFFEMLGV
jgi:bcr-type benzoyl-CoA reductase subunit B